MGLFGDLPSAKDGSSRGDGGGSSETPAKRSDGAATTPGSTAGKTGGWSGAGSALRAPPRKSPALLNPQMLKAQAAALRAQQAKLARQKEATSSDAPGGAAKVAKDELASIAEFEPVTSASKREEAKRLAEQLAYAEAVAEAERLVEEERVRILQMQEAAKQNRARTVGEARRLVSEQYGVATLANNAKAFKASAKEASPSWLLWE